VLDLFEYNLPGRCGALTYSYQLDCTPALVENNIQMGDESVPTLNIGAGAAEGTYNLCICAKGHTDEVCEPLVLVVMGGTNTAPYFLLAVGNQAVNTGESLDVFLPGYADDNLEDAISVAVDLEGGSSFMSADLTAMTLSVTPTENAHAGTHIVTLTVTDDNSVGGVSVLSA